MSGRLVVLHCTRKSTQLSRGTPFIFLQIKNHISFSPIQACFLDTADNLEKVSVLYETPITVFGRNYFDKLFYRLFKHVPYSTSNQINEFIIKNNVSIVHFHYGSDATIFYHLFKRLKIPSVVSFYGYDATSFPKWYFGLGRKLLNRIVFSNASFVLAMSKEMKTELVNLGCPDKKAIVHYFGNETERFVFPDRTYNKSEPLKMLIMASLVEQKGHLFLLSALKKIDNNKRYQLTIVGEGPLESDIRSFVIENNLSDNVEFKRNLPYGSPAMVNEYHSADIYIQPSVTTVRSEKEGIPGALVEAMVSGLPVISTYHAGIPSVVYPNATGLLVKEWDVEGLANCINTLLLDTGLRERLGKAAREYALKELDAKVKARELEEIYLSLLS